MPHIYKCESQEECSNRSGYQGQGQVITSSSICEIILFVPTLDTCFWHKAPDVEGTAHTERYACCLHLIVFAVDAHANDNECIINQISRFQFESKHFVKIPNYINTTQGGASESTSNSVSEWKFRASITTKTVEISRHNQDDFYFTD